MRLENAFDVPAPIERVWPLLLDVERVAPCLPGAEVDERVDDATYRVRVSVKLGPMALAYGGELEITSADEDARCVVMTAAVAERRGHGTARATITTTLSGQGDGTHANVVTDLNLTGRVAQMGRGIVEDVSRRLLGEFAACLGKRVAGTPGTSPAEPDAAPQPIRGFSLALSVLWARLRGRS